MDLYTVRIPCECLGAWRVPGEPFEVSAEQARPLSPPHGGVLVPYTAPAAVAEPVPVEPVAAPAPEPDPDPVPAPAEAPAPTNPEPINERQHRARGRKRRAS